MYVPYLLVAAIIGPAGIRAFDPGCSFATGGCIYTVKLGQEQHCDRATRTATDSNFGLQGCSCQDVAGAKQNMQSLWSQLRSLQMDFDVITHTVNTTHAQLSQRSTDVITLQGHSYSLAALVAHKDMLLNQSKIELDNILGQMDIEMGRLRTLLTDTTTGVNACKARLLVVGNTPTIDPALAGVYVTHYCDFEDSHHCNFTSESSSSSSVTAHWNQGTGRQNTRSGPIEDHTFGSPKGHYMYIDPYHNPPYYTTTKVRKARIVSPEFSPATEYCIRFWYTAYGPDIAYLNVYARIGAGDGYPVFSKHGQVDAYWHMAQISLDSEYTALPFRLVFEATTRSYYKREHMSGSSSSTNHVYDGYGYIAIDDLYVYNTTCKAAPATCPDNTRRFVHGNTTSCYTFHTGALSWYDAVEQCRLASPNSQLVSVQSVEEQHYLVDVIQNDAALTTAGTAGFYTSGNDERTERHFMWTDTGYPEPVNYTHWRAGQPNNVGNVQDCLLLQYAATGYEWGDVNCNDAHPYICESHM